MQLPELSFGLIAFLCSRDRRRQSPRILDFWTERLLLPVKQGRYRILRHGRSRGIVVSSRLVERGGEAKGTHFFPFILSRRPLVAAKSCNCECDIFNIPLFLADTWEGWCSAIAINSRCFVETAGINVLIAHSGKDLTIYCNS